MEHNIYGSPCTQILILQPFWWTSVIGNYVPPHKCPPCRHYFPRKSVPQTNFRRELFLQKNVPSPWKNVPPGTLPIGNKCPPRDLFLGNSAKSVPHRHFPESDVYQGDTGTCLTDYSRWTFSLPVRHSGCQETITSCRKLLTKHHSCYTQHRVTKVQTIT